MPSPPSPTGRSADGRTHDRLKHAPSLMPWCCWSLSRFKLAPPPPVVKKSLNLAKAAHRVLQTPRYALRTAGSWRRSAAGPLIVIRPFSRTYPRSAISREHDVLLDQE